MNNFYELLEKLSIEEKAALLAGTNFMYTNSVPRLNIPSLCFADGPHGLRKQIGKPDNGISKSEPATAFPTAATSASSWNSDNLRKMGEAIGDECRYYGVNVLLGPSVNIKKNPTCGRNFEYFSEDPLITGVLASAFVDGVQSRKVGVSVKHFAINNSENYRFIGNSVIDERTSREIYLKAFEIIVKNTKPYTIMSSYNQINGVFASENKMLLTDILREEWGFDGLVMTDWGGTKDRVRAVEAGLDLEMPGDTAHNRKMIIDAVKNGTLSVYDLNKAVSNVLTLIEKSKLQKKLDSFDKEKHHALSIDIATDSAVLLENDGILPLKTHTELFVVGELFEKMRYQGSGSSMINPTKVVSPRRAFDDAKVKYTFSMGYRENSVETDRKLLEQALSEAKNHEQVIVFAGLTDFTESEGEDRKHLSLPHNQLELIEKLIKLEKKVIVILFGGSPVELPFQKEVAAILNMYLPGQGGGEAVRRLLFGEVNPSGKLVETWVNKYSDVPFHDIYSNSTIELYKESIYVGYRYYDSASVEIMYPFGYGLSYTKFEYSKFNLKTNKKTVEVSFAVKNIGNVQGAEVSQLYVLNNTNGVFKAKRELRGFSKVYLHPNEEKEVTITFNKDDLKYYDVRQKAWILENGSYEIQVGSSLSNILFTKELVIENEEKVKLPYSESLNNTYKKFNIKEISNEVFENLVEYPLPKPLPSLPLHIESIMTDFKQTFFGRILYNVVLSVAEKQRKKANKMSAGPERDNTLKGYMFLKRIMDTNSPRSFSMSGGKAMPYNIAEAFVEIGNGHLIRGIKKIAKKIKVPKLPSEMNDK